MAAAEAVKLVRPTGRHRRRPSVAERARELGMFTGVLADPRDAAQRLTPRKPERPSNYGVLL